MLRLTRDDQWFPERIAGLVAEVHRDETALCAMVGAEAVRARFPHVDGRAQLPRIRDWLLVIARQSGASPGPSLDGWSAGTAARIVQFANAKLDRAGAFRA